MSNRCKTCDWENINEREFCEKCNAPLTKDVFISYSRKDYIVDGNPIEGCIISKIKQAFDDNNISYWFDEEGIYSGDEFASEITRAIRTSKLFLFISSMNSNKSLWTSNEISTALAFKKKIIPFRLDESPYNDSVMMKIASLDFIDCKNRDVAIARLITAIRHHLPNKKSLITSENTATPATANVSNRNKAISDESTNNEFNSISTNDFSVTIADKKTPIAILVGPTAVGKTMTLVRLVRFLAEQGYTVQPDRIFRSADNTDYAKLCDGFQERINSSFAVDATSLLDCMLIKIHDHTGKKELQIVDMSGELYCNGLNTSNQEQLHPFLPQILQSSNPFVWVILIEPHWKDNAHRIEFVKTIHYLEQRFFKPQDKVMLVCNKIDKLPSFQRKSINNSDTIIELFKEEYPGMMELFRNHNPLTRLFRQYNCSVVPFSTGYYTQSHYGGIVYVPSSKDFPQKLWREISK